MKKPTPNYFVLRFKINNHNSPFFIGKNFGQRGFSFLVNPFQLSTYFHAKAIRSFGIIKSQIQTNSKPEHSNNFPTSTI
jgi:hypothetical protein